MVKRADSWTPEEDILLVESVINGVAKGEVQLKIFHNVGIKVNRTAKAVAFRWNKVLRKQYQTAFAKAMEIRLEAKRAKKEHKSQQYVDPEFDNEWDALTFKENIQPDEIDYSESRIGTRVVLKSYSLNDLTQLEMEELYRVLSEARSQTLEHLRMDIKFSLTR
jgi:RsfA family transcription factor